jgi:hypothetical protein
VAVVLDYEPSIDGVPYDPAPEGGGVDRLRLFTQPERTGVPVVDVGPAAVVRAGLYRFTFSEPADGVYFTVVSWRETATAPAFTDADGTLIFPLVTRQAYELLTGQQLHAILGNTVSRAACDAAAAVVNGHAEGYTRGRSVHGDDPPRDLVAVATAAALRLVGNLQQRQSVAVEGQSVAGAWRGWTIAEQQVLNRYRRRSA